MTGTLFRGTEPRYGRVLAEMSPIESEFATAADAAAHDAWFQAKVTKALASREPPISHEEVMIEVKAILETRGNAASRLAR